MYSYASIELINTDRYIEALKAVAEPTRLRLLALCAAGDAAVNECAAVLAQSEPSVSRHLKVLEAAGLLRRRRRGRHIYFQTVTDGQQAPLPTALLAPLGNDDARLLADRAQLRQLRQCAATETGLMLDSRVGRTLASLVANKLRDSRPTVACVTHLCHAELLLPLIACVPSLTVWVDSSAQRSLLRRWLGERHSNVVMPLRALALSADSEVQCRMLVLSDCSGIAVPALPATLQAARAGLSFGGTLWLCVNYDALDGTFGAAHPLIQLRRALTDVGLHCERIEPIEVDGQHLLFSTAKHAVRAQRAAG